MERGESGPDDPQFGVALAYSAVRDVKVLAFGDTPLITVEVRDNPQRYCAPALCLYGPAVTDCLNLECDASSR